MLFPDGTFHFGGLVCGRDIWRLGVSAVWGGSELFLQLGELVVHVCQSGHLGWGNEFGDGGEKAFVGLGQLVTYGC
ncbi:hypothetical protein GCM10009733_006280 [Nonomuraea maheshkhaliensis]|uniref:Uncharacterized protein n=1 Tax=Nonomuraea maheshkhaliensis TaxID=419590 RepID=A0ABP4QPW5_9ACTN